MKKKMVGGKVISWVVEDENKKNNPKENKNKSVC